LFLEIDMTYRKLALFSLMLTATGACLAQAPSPEPAAAAAPTSSSSTASPSTAPAAPSAPAAASSAAASSSDASSIDPELVRKARREGYKPEKQKNGDTLFCTKGATLGTKFETKQCVTPSQMPAIIEARQDQRNDLSHERACTGSACNGH
jgi:hypothetical protein